MVVLREEKGEWQHSEGYRRLQLEYGMPIDWRERLWLAATVHACRAVVAARLRWPDRAGVLLRRLRVLTMAGHLLDDSDTLELAAEQAGLPVAEIAAYCAEPEVEEALRADMRAARSPSPASRAQDYKLGGPAEERRYTCPSYELLAGDARVDLPGFRPIEAYETALANLEPSLDPARRPGVGRRGARLGAVPARHRRDRRRLRGGGRGGCDREIPDVRAELARVAFEPVGGDGYWSL